MDALYGIVVFLNKMLYYVFKNAEENRSGNKGYRKGLGLIDDGEGADGGP